MTSTERNTLNLLKEGIERIDALTESPDEKGRGSFHDPVRGGIEQTSELVSEPESLLETTKSAIAKLVVDTSRTTSFHDAIDSSRFHTGGSQTLPRRFRSSPMDFREDNSTMECREDVASEPPLSPAISSNDSFSTPPILAPLSSKMGSFYHSDIKDSDPLSPDSIAESVDVVDARIRNRLNSAAILNVTWDVRAFRRWITCICEVNFDLELGQALELIYPPTLLSEAEKKNISFSAFPDSNSSSHLGDSVFTFRIRSASALAKLPVFATRASMHKLDRTSSPSVSSLSDPMAFLSPLSSGKEGGEDEEGCRFGYVFFRQEKDSQLKRGFFQKSLVLLSPHPFYGLFSAVIKSIGSKYFDIVNTCRRRGDSELVIQEMARSILDEACSQVASWPSPPTAWDFVKHVGTSWQSVPMEYPFMEQKLCVGFPAQPNQPLFQGVPTSTIPTPMPPLRPCRLYDFMHTHLEMLWILYELVLLCEPILVQGDSPRSCGEAVWSMVEMIKPLNYAGEWRPYFTVQDPEFRLLRQKSLKEVSSSGEGFGWRGGILGVTNPVFTKVLGPRWSQNVVVVKKVQVMKRPEAVSDAIGGGRVIAASVEGRRQQEAQAMASIKTQNPILAFFSSFTAPPEDIHIVGPGHGFAPSGQQKLLSTTFLEICQSITTKHKPFFRKDRRLLQKVAEASMRGSSHVILNNILRRYFAELTAEFMTPLEKYFDELVTVVDKVTLFTLARLPEIRPFGMESFLKRISDNRTFFGPGGLTLFSAHVVDASQETDARTVFHLSQDAQFCTLVTRQNGSSNNESSYELFTVFIHGFR
jgi:hypothetical protein